MAFNNVPVNGWPQIKQLEELDAIAKKIDDMPTFSSTDRDWLDEWESKLPELPADPETDGVKVLTATTESGATVKSWEEPASGGMDYSTTEQNTGIKWIDDKDIYRKVVDLGALPNATTKNVAHGITGISEWVKIEGVANNTTDGSAYSLPIVYDPDNATNNTRMSVTSENVVLVTKTDRSAFDACYAILYYTKTATQQTRKRGK